MSDAPLTLASEFPTPSRADWLAAVDRALRGADFERALVSTTLDGIRIDPLYTADDVAAEGDQAGLPGFAPLLRGGSPWPRPQGRWDIRTSVVHPDPAAANAAALTDLANGATSLDIMIDAGGSLTGVSCRSRADLERALAGVLLDLAPVSLRAGAHGGVVARWLVGLLADQQVTGATGCLGIDPVSALAADGLLPQGMDAALAEGAELAVAAPGPRAFRASGTSAFDAGASEAQEIAFVLGAATAYLRAMADAGLSAEQAAGQIVLEVAADVDVFATIAKLRALRHCWATVLEASGVPVAGVGAAQVEAVAGGRWLTEVDPWVNLLRGTAAALGAVVGGADAVVVAPFDSAEGLAGDLGRRLARNTQLLLQEESHVGQVLDPAGGSYYVEALSAAIAEAAWALFQQVEGRGGIVAALTSGWLAEQVAAVAADRDRGIATRRRPITGVSEFPLLGEARPTPPDWPPVDERPPVPLDGAPTTAPRLVARRLAEPFEALRAAAEAVASQPAVFLASIGTPAAYTARATFAANAFATAGIRSVGDRGFADAAEAAAAYRASGAPVAVICGTDAAYADLAVPFAAALKGAGAERVYLAGRPGERSDELAAAGVDEFLFVGVDVLDTMSRLLRQLGI